MTRWIFFGRVLPERVPISIGTQVDGEGDFKDLSVKLKYSIYIHLSQILCNVEVTSGDPDIDTLRNLVESLVRILVDTIAHRDGISLDVEISSAGNCDVDGRWVFGVEIPAVGLKRHVDKVLSKELVTAVFGDPAAQAALSSFREAMRMPVDCGFFCYRAIEAAMQSLKLKPTENETAAWARLRTSLLVDRDAINRVKKFADAPRHGRVSSIHDKERADILFITDEILDRYLRFIVGGRAPLSGIARLTAQP